MKKIYANVLVAILVTSTAGIAAESGEPSVAVITGEVRDPTSREITFKYGSPAALGKQAEQRVVLDSRNRFTLEIPVVRGTLVRGSYKGRGVPWKPVRQAVAFLLKPSPLIFYVEPGDSLHISVHPGHLYTSFRFSGQNADNNRFIAEWYPTIPGFPEENQGLQGNGGGRLLLAWRTGGERTSLEVSGQAAYEICVLAGIHRVCETLFQLHVRIPDDLLSDQLPVRHGP